MTMTNIKELNIILCGVGGQGVILLSELLGQALVNEGLNIQGSEVLGMSQRGGSVFSNIRVGSHVYAPLTPQGKCDLLIAVEPSEALRYIKDLNSSSLVVVNTRQIIPYTVSVGQSCYPDFETVLENIRKITNNIIILDAAKIAQEAGNLLTANIVMLGALFGSGKIPTAVETMKELIIRHVPTDARDANLRAFDLGYETVTKKLKK